MDELLAEFLTESAENLAALDIELVKLEQNPNAPGLLANIFRLVHTIKGTSGFFGLPRLELLAHAAESVLGRFRDGELVVTPDAISVILAAIDGIKAILAALEATEAEPPGDDGEVIARLNALAEHQPADPLPEPGVPARPEMALPQPPAEPEPVVEVQAPTEPVVEVQAQTEPVVEAQALAEASRESISLTVTSALAEPAPHESAVAMQSIRVSVELLESLMTTVSELVLSRNQLLQIARRQKDSEFAAPLQRLNQVVSELQEGVMKTRMQPVGTAWGKLPRIVRDLAHDLGKKIDLVMKGSDTELDRQVLELIRDPLTHMVRNAVDHGTEHPDERRRAGKPETGVIVLEASHQGSHIVIEISDDGRGLSTDKIKAKALNKGLASEAELAGLTDAQLQQYIFRPGFSTADVVTSVSGRGVGMDVVRTNIEKIGGAIELNSRAGLGSKFTIKIPLTLTIVSALIVEVSGERFAVPQTAVIELVRTRDGGANAHRIERVNNTPVLRLRDRLLPLVVLEDLLKLERRSTDAPAERFVIVTQVGAQVFGMIVDQVFDTEEIVVKPVAPVTRHVSVFSGNTILGDGSVIMILDPGGIAGAIGEGAASGGASQAAAEQRVEDTQDKKTTLLVFRAGAGGPKAVPLRSIVRLEEFNRRDIEGVNGQHVIQYRGKLMPVVPYDGMMNPDTKGRQPALVFADGERTMALLVDAVVDIVETELDVHRGPEMPGIIGSAIIAGRATELIDAGYFCKQAFLDWCEPLTCVADAADLLSSMSLGESADTMDMARAA